MRFLKYCFRRDQYNYWDNQEADLTALTVPLFASPQAPALLTTPSTPPALVPTTPPTLVSATPLPLLTIRHHILTCKRFVMFDKVFYLHITQLKMFMIILNALYLFENCSEVNIWLVG